MLINGFGRCIRVTFHRMLGQARNSMLGGPEIQPETDMSQYKSDLLRLLDSRGYIHQLTDAEGLDTLAAKQIVPAYIGFDATAPSLHVGSLVQIMMLRWFAADRPQARRADGRRHHAVGDPTGRDESARCSATDRSTRTSPRIETIFDRFLKFGDGPTDAIMVNNADWLNKLNYIDFLREVGRTSPSTACFLRLGEAPARSRAAE
jgi:tyrosyl-tRNA synthetase